MVNLKPYWEAAYPAVCVSTFEDNRVAETLKSFDDKSPVWQIAAVGGLKDFRTGATIKSEDEAGYGEAFEAISNQKRGFLIVLDFQHMIKNAAAYRSLLASFASCKSNNSIIVLLAPHWELPDELQHEIPVLRDTLPSPEELTAPLEVILEAAELKIEDTHRRDLLQAARGLTLQEAENAFALAAPEGLKREVVEDQKTRLINQYPYLTIEKPLPESSLGGLGRYKNFIHFELLPVKNDPQLSIKAILASGVPGTGKTMGAKVLGSLLQCPVMRADPAAAKGGIVGQSEAAMTNIMGIARAVAPVILFFDEFEKWCSGAESSGKTDGGTTSGMLSILLTAMQDIKDNNEQVLIYCTANDFEKIQPELRRRFNSNIFFFDLPPYSERLEIATIHLEKYGVEVDGLPQVVAELADKFTGAEIENLIMSAARRTKRQITAESLELAAKQIKPIYKTQRVEELRKQGQDFMLPANDPEEVTPKGKRAIQ